MVVQTDVQTNDVGVQTDVQTNYVGVQTDVVQNNDFGMLDGLDGESISTLFDEIFGNFYFSYIISNIKIFI